MATTFHIACDPCRCLLALPRLGSEADQSLVELGERFTPAHRRLIESATGPDWREFVRFVDEHAGHALVIGSPEAGHGLDYRTGVAVPTLETWKAAMNGRTVAGRLDAAEALPYLGHLDLASSAEVIGNAARRVAKERSATVFGPLVGGLARLIQDAFGETRDRILPTLTGFRELLVSVLDSGPDKFVAAAVDALALVGEPSDINPLLDRLQQADPKLSSSLATALFGIGTRAKQQGNGDVLSDLIAVFERHARKTADGAARMRWLMLLGEAGNAALPALFGMLDSAPVRAGSTCRALDRWLVHALGKAAATATSSHEATPTRPQSVTPLVSEAGDIRSVVSWHERIVVADDRGRVQIQDDQGDWETALDGTKNQTTLRASESDLFVCIRGAVVVISDDCSDTVELAGSDGLRVDLDPKRQTAAYLHAGRLAVADVAGRHEPRLFERLPVELHPRVLRAIDQQYVAVGGNGVVIYELATGADVEMIDLPNVTTIEPVDATQVAIGCQNGSIHLWELHTGRCVELTSGHSAEGPCTIHGGGVGVVALAFRHGNLASLGADGVIRVWDLSSKTIVFDCSLGNWPLLPIGICRAMCWHQEDVVVGTQLGLFRVRLEATPWPDRSDVASSVPTVPRADLPIVNANIPIGPHATARSDGATAVAGPSGLTIETPECAHDIPELGPLTACCFSPCGRWLVAVGWRGEVSWVSTRTWAVERRHTPHAVAMQGDSVAVGNALLDLAFSPSGRFLAVGGLLRAVSIFDRQQHAYIRAGRNHQVVGDCASLAFDASGTRLFIGALEMEQITIVSPLSGAVLQELRWHDGSLPAIRGVWDLTCEGDDLTAWINGEQQRIARGHSGWEIA